MNETGTIVGHFGVAVDVRFADGTTRSIRVKRNSGHVVGDAVIVDDGVLSRQPRRNALRRRSPGGGIHVVAANLDLLIVVVAEDPPARIGLVDRCAAAAAAENIDVMLVINKSDLGDDAARRMRAVFAEHMDIIEMSATGGFGLEELRLRIGKSGRAMFTGHSGVGKSSLTNALLPKAALRIGHTNATTGRGRHTTTASTLHLLPTGGELVDTPGIREFGIVDISAEDLAHFFVGLQSDTPCKFRNCLHLHEPHCGIALAVERGEIPKERLTRYRELLAEIGEQ